MAIESKDRPNPSPKSLTMALHYSKEVNMFSLEARSSRRWIPQFYLGLTLFVGVLFMPLQLPAFPSQPPSSNALTHSLNKNDNNLPGELIVKFRAGVSAAMIKKVHAQIGSEVLSAIPNDYSMQMIRGTRGQSSEELLQAYSERPEVDYVRTIPRKR